ncbi:hypothetical protein H5410_047545 [Solanum commersonii]|uniref:Uncharacterized protein n=1 Tax=Solanum commersonii TaxID=4109 RepID=A0A9J5XHM0_SOLCO|nr:hypothetical protein H5410_047545 [Solanum commersonii]
MQKPESKDKGKSQTIQKYANSSKEEKGTSSTKVGKRNLKEEEYLAFTRYIYNLLEERGETFGVLGTTSLFSRISIFPNGSPDFTAQLFEFGYLDRVYTKPDWLEISKLPEQLRNSVKTYAQGDGVYCRFFSIAIESKDLQTYFPTINYIMVEKLKYFNIKATGVDKKLHHLNKKWIQTKRVFGIKALYFILKHYYNEDYKTINTRHKDQNKITARINGCKSNNVAGCDLQLEGGTFALLLPVATTTVEKVFLTRMTCGIEWKMNSWMTI